MTTTFRALNVLLLAFAILMALTLFTSTVQSTDTVSKTPERRVTGKSNRTLPPYVRSALEAKLDEINANQSMIDASVYRPSAIQSPTLAHQAYLKASNTDSGDSFGYSVAISGDTAVVGAPFENSSAGGVDGNQSDNSTGDAGAAYVFVRSGNTWIQQAYLKSSNPWWDDWFGSSVAVSGDTIVIGAQFEDSNAIGVDGNQNNDSATNSGAAYVFVRSGETWTQQAYLKASNTGAGDQFGIDVAVSGDTIGVGAFQEDSNATEVNGNQSDKSAIDSGAVYIFVRSGATWTQQAYLKATNTEADDWFGWSVGVSGDTVVVGAEQEDSNATGVGGNQGDNSASNSGAAYVFGRSGVAWSQQAYLKASNTAFAANFGYSVAISEDTVIVGAINESSSATGVNANPFTSALQAAGAAYVFAKSGIAWAQQAYLKASNTGEGDNFGRSVDVSGDTAVVGAYAEDSNAIGVGGNQSDNSANGAGAAYIFNRSGAMWSQHSYLKASNTEALDFFGRSVGVSGGSVAVGAFREASNATGVNGDQSNNSAIASGAVYVYAPFVRAPQSISFSPIGNRTYGDAPFALSATASSGLFVSFAVLSGPATVAGNTLTMTGVGIVTVRASQNGDTNYEAAADVTQSFTVQAGQPVLTRNNVLTVSPAGSATITSNHLQVVAAGIPASQIVYTLVSPLSAKGQVKLNGTLVGWLLNPSTGHYYTSTAPGHRGATASEAASYGAFLTTINNATENVWITNNFSRALNAYNGLNDPGGWDNGESSAYRNWYPGEPNSGQETAVHMYLNVPDAEGAQWNDIDPNERVHPGIVEKNDSNGILLSFTQEDIDQGRVTYHHFAGSSVTTPTDPDDFTFTVSDGAGGNISNTIFLINVDSTAPTADIVDVTPDPRADSVAAITIGFTEAVNGINLQDFQLRRDGGSNLLTIAQSITTSDNIIWTLGNLSELTSTPGSYTLTLTATGSGITDTFGNALAGDSSDTWVVFSPTPQTITFGPLANKILGDAPFTVNATASSGLPVSFSIVSGPATISGNTLTITGIGTVVVRASQEGNENYSAAIPLEQSFSVEDRTAPVPDVGTLPTIIGECSASITSPPTATDDSAGQITGTTTDSTSYSSQGTFIVHWSYDDGHGNFSTQTQTVIVQDISPPAFSQTPSTDGLGAYYKFDEVSGINTPDSSGNSRTGQLIGTSLINTGLPSVGFANPFALSFNGTSDYVLIPPSAIDNLSSGTIAAWVYLNTRDQEVITAKQHNNVDSTAVFAVGLSGASNTPTDIQTPGVLYFHAKNGTGFNAAGVTPLNTGQWYHVVVTFTTTQAKIYVNGVVDSVTNGDFSIPTDLSGTATTIGAWIGDGLLDGRDTNYLDGRLDDVRIYHRALSDSEVAAFVSSAPLADVTQSTDSASCSAVVNYPTPVATDNCTTPVPVSCDHPSGSTFPLGTTTVTCTATDNAGNSSTASFTVTVNDATAPVPNLATLPTVTGECSASIQSPPTATDNCGGQITGTTTDPTSYTTPGTFVVHWNYNDRNGNVSTQTQTVTVQEASISVDAGSDQVFCNNTAVTMAGNTPAGGTGTWTLVSGSGTIAEPNNPSTVISDLGFGSNVFRWTISNGSCGSSSDDVVITRNSCPSVETLFSRGDSFLKASVDNTNEGANERLRLQSAGNNRAAVMFDLTGISTVGLQSATLILTVAENSNNWGASGRLVDAHRLLVDWTEGNGRNDVMVGAGPGFRGTGEGITWNCSKDLNIANQSANCSPLWNGGNYAAATAPGALHTNGLFGEVLWDVTADVLAGANFGWLIRKQNEGQNGQVRYYSREGAILAGNASLAPSLVLVYSP